MPQTGSIEFWNTSEYDASVYTLDGQGNENFVIDLAPDASSVQSTAVGQQWIVKDTETGEQAGSVTGTAEYQLYKIRITKGGGKEGPQKSGSGS